VSQETDGMLKTLGFKKRTKCVW